MANPFFAPENPQALEHILEEIALNLGASWTSKSKNWEISKLAFRNEMFQWVLTDPRQWLDKQFNE